MTEKPKAGNGAFAAGDLAGLVGGLLILIAYLALPLRSDSTATGLAFIDSGATFPALTLMAGIAAAAGAAVNLTSLRERMARWYLAGMGILAIVFLLDNTLRGKAGLALGGWLAMLGGLILIAQAVLPRPAQDKHASASEVVLGVIRIALATLWFTQLLWKLPWNNFGCTAGPLIAQSNSSGLCDWLGREIASPRYRLYKDFLSGFVSPNLGWMAYLIVGGEAFVCFSLLFGFLTRLGGLTGFLMGINLFIGLTAVPGEWDWTYLMLPLLNLVFLAVGGRYFGLDALLYQWLRKRADDGKNRMIHLAASFVR